MTLLRAQSLSFAYAVEPVLREVSVTLDAGQVVAVLGPNGSGKSTLIKCLLGHLRAAGEVAWDGRGLAQWKQRELARYVAYLPQAPLWEAGQRVADVLRSGRAPYWRAFGLESTRDLEVVREVAELLEMGDLLDRPMDEISGGQRQRVFVGRALVQEPKALLLDEPSTFLDLRHQVELFALLRRLAGERQLGVLMASHDLNLAGAYAHRLILLEEGKVAAQGGADEVLRGEVLSGVYGLPLERSESAGAIHIFPKRR